MAGGLERMYIAYLTESRKIGEASPHSPQHLTIAPPFLAERQAVIAVAQKAQQKFKQFAITIDKTVYLGTKKNIAVWLIKPNSELQTLHNFLIAELEAKKINLSRINHIKDKYLPHITIKNRHKKLNNGTALMLDHIAIMLKTDKERTLIHCVQLKQ